MSTESITAPCAVGAAEPPESVWNNALQALLLNIGLRVCNNETLKSNPDIVRFLVTDIDAAARELRK